MLILDIPNLKFVDVHLVFFSKKNNNTTNLQPSPAIRNQRNQRKNSRHDLRAQGSCTFQVCQPQIFMNKDSAARVSGFTHSFNSLVMIYHLFTAIVLLLRLGFIPSIHWWFFTIFFLDSYFFSLLNRWVGGASFKRFMVISTIFFLDSYFFSLLNRWGWEEIPPKKKVEDWKSKGGFENC